MKWVQNSYWEVRYVIFRKRRHNKRLHGGFVSENEVERVVGYIKKQVYF